jgi:hypothetical protein
MARYNMGVNEEVPIVKMFENRKDDTLDGGREVRIEINLEMK